MIKGIGVDIIETKRIAQSVKKYGDSFLNRIFTKKEIEYCKNSLQLAGRFAAKEAYSKALGTGIDGGINWKDIEVINDKKGKPHLYIKNKLARRVHLSISHSQNYAVAFVVI